MTSALRRLRRGLPALMVLSLVFALCPCLTCGSMDPDDCCVSEGLSISGACCEGDGGSRAAAPSTTVMAAASGSPAAYPMAVALAVPAPVHQFKIPTRPVVARAVLRI